MENLKDWMTWFCIACHVIFPRQYGQTNNGLPSAVQPTVSHFVSVAHWRVHYYAYNMSLLCENNELWTTKHLNYERGAFKTTLSS